MARKRKAAAQAGSYNVTTEIKGETRECEVIKDRGDGKLLVRTVGDHIIQRRFVVDIESGLSPTGLVCVVTKA